MTMHRDIYIYMCVCFIGLRNGESNGKEQAKYMETMAKGFSSLGNSSEGGLVGGVSAWGS